jgi:ElaB/YqjD/DUF883 family membrane-anchored ribosome-binding protein
MMSNSVQSSQVSGSTSVRSNGAPTTERVRLKAHEAVDSAAARAEDVERRIREEAAEAQVKLTETKEAATGQFEESLARVESFIRKRPMTAAGIAFAAGILVSRLARG